MFNDVLLPLLLLLLILLGPGRYSGQLAEARARGAAIKQQTLQAEAKLLRLVHNYIRIPAVNTLSYPCC